MALCGMTKSMFFRLCTRAPRTLISSASPGTAGRGAELVGRFSGGFGAIGVNQKLYAAKPNRANHAFARVGRVLYGRRGSLSTAANREGDEQYTGSPCISNSS